MARAPRDVDMTTLSELVGDGESMTILVTREVIGASGKDEEERIGTYTVPFTDVQSGALYEQVRAMAGGGRYFYKASKPGKKGVVLWDQRGGGEPRVPDHVRQADAARRAATAPTSAPPPPTPVAQAVYPQGVPTMPLPMMPG